MSTPPLTRTVGSAERAMRALLEREISRENLSFAQWTALVFTSSAALSHAEIAQRQLAGRIVADAPESQRAVDSLIGLDMLTDSANGSLQHTEKGRRVFTDLSAAVEGVTRNLYGDLPAADLEATHRTLVEVAKRANLLLGEK